MAAYQRIMRKARAYVGVRDRMRQNYAQSSYWRIQNYLNLFNAFFNSLDVKGKMGKYRAHNIKHMRALRLSGVHCPLA